MRLLTGAGLALALLLFATSAVAQAPCAPYEEMEAYLAQHYGERPISWGISQRGFLARLFMSPDGATWTLVLVSPGPPHRSCAVDAGRDWRWRGPKKPQGPPA